MFFVLDTISINSSAYINANVSIQRLVYTIMNVSQLIFQFFLLIISGYVLGRAGLFACLSVCLSVCPSAESLAK